jgi:hypothetical protein
MATEKPPREPGIVWMDVCDVMVLLGAGAVTAGLFLVGIIYGLIGGGALMMVGGLALARLRATAATVQALGSSPRGGDSH